jgi:toxin YoeB
MEIRWSRDGWEDYLYWQETNINSLRKINEMIREISRNPFRGIGKPEPLRGELAGWWSRRISGEHRIVFQVRGKGEEQFIFIMMCRFHYGKKAGH